MLNITVLQMPHMQQEKTAQRHMPQYNSSKSRLVKVKVRCQCDQTESQLPTASFLLSLQELPNSQLQRLPRQDIIIWTKRPTIQWALSSAVHFPQVILLILQEADVVQVDVIFCVRSSTLSFDSSTLMCALQCL